MIKIFLFSSNELNLKSYSHFKNIFNEKIIKKYKMMMEDINKLFFLILINI